MALGIHRLSPAFVKASVKPGRYSDGGGLYLNISRGESKTYREVNQKAGPLSGLKTKKDGRWD